MKTQKKLVYSAANNKIRSNLLHDLQSYAMLLPQFIGFFVFSIYPILWVSHFAFYNYNGLNKRFVGMDNFVRIFTRDLDFWKSIGNTLILAAVKLPIELSMALVLAVILNGKIKGKTLFRTIFYLPNIISVAIIGLIFYFMFASFEGIVNNLLLVLKIIEEPVHWFSNKWSALFVLASASIWQNFGINMLFFLAGLQSIPAELYECAELDGAGKIRQFFVITIPMLGPIMRVVCMLAIIGSIKITDLVLVLTNGQPAGQTEVVMTYIFKFFFAYGDGAQSVQIGYGASLGMVTAVILGIITVFYLKVTQKANN